MVKITFDVDRRINVQGTVREIAPLIDPQTRQATVKINLPQNSAIRSGLFLRTHYPLFPNRFTDIDSLQDRLSRLCFVGWSIDKRKRNQSEKLIPH